VVVGEGESQSSLVIGTPYTDEKNETGKLAGAHPVSRAVRATKVPHRIVADLLPDIAWVPGIGKCDMAIGTTDLEQRA